jgi:hypothetical protein
MLDRVVERRDDIADVTVTVAVESYPLPAMMPAT